MRGTHRPSRTRDQSTVEATMSDRAVTVQAPARRTEDGSTLAPHDAIPSQEHRVTSRHTEADARIAIDDRLRQAGWDPLDKSMVGTEVQAADSSAAASVVDRSRARPFEAHAPVYDLEAAAGAFGPDRMVGAAGDKIGWAPVSESVRLTRDHSETPLPGRMDGTRARPGGPRPARAAGARSHPGSAFRILELLAATRRRAPGAANHGGPAPDDDRPR